MNFASHDMPRTSLPVAARWGLGVALVVASVALAWWLSASSPASSSSRPPPAPEDPEREAALVQWRETSREKEAAYDALVAEDAVPSPEHIRLLEEAHAAQQEYVRAQASPAWADTERERVLATRVASARGRVMLLESERQEALAEERFRAGDRPAGVAALQEALRLQREINLSPADASVRRTMREAELSARLDSVEAEPLAAEVERLEDAAQAALVREDPAAAAQAYEQAASFQRRLNQLYPRTRFASTARLDRLETELASLAAGRLVQERDRLVAAARAQDVAGAAVEAGRLFAEAREVQARLNQEFRQSRFANATELESLEVARQTALSRPRHAAFVVLEERITAALRARRVDEVRETLEQARKEAAEIAQATPRSSLLTPDWNTRVEYLASIVDVLPIVQGSVLDHLRPIPGVKVSMLSGEVSQSLYSAIAGANPSRVEGNRLPVESLTAAEATEFCRKMSWVLGRTVRLPTRAEFSAAMQAGFGDAWTSANAGGMPRAVDAGEANEAGFRNLQGNVAEWVTGTDDDQMLIAGGSYADPALEAGDAPFRLAPKTERYRTVGFRVVVE